MKKIKLLDTGQRNETIVRVLSIGPRERKKFYAREYYRRPYVIAKRRTPEMLAHKAEYDRKYLNRPGVKERKRELRRRQYLRTGK